ncbi:MAG TPA: OprD family outer membrane porin, partial [Burkholderiales bacterium]|nr:OprD family outer membrane porin [Burkholderiales bacterium]
MTRGDASLLTLAASLALLAGASAPALGQTKPRSSANQGVTPMDEIDLGTPLPAHMSFQPPENPEDRVPFIHDSRFGAQLRSFYLKQDKFNGTASEAWTLGGALAYQSGFLADLLRLGAVAYTSQPVYAPKSRDGTGLLETGQSGYSALGQLFAEARFSDQLTGALGRKEYSTPYINGNDSRMSPNTFEGLSVY